MMRLEGKVAIVTGAATGIGQAIAVRFAKEGAAIVVDYIGGPDVARMTTDRIKSAGGRVSAIRADVSDSEQVANLIRESVRTFGKLDIVVNNAGLKQATIFLISRWMKSTRSSM
jgi:NAD(P)-dependent dehydrogenase (short-subunit alcohol dehydrogenase family)